MPPCSRLRDLIQRKYKLAVTVGYGPRFLHSTGQLHKGDGGNGLFIQITAAAATDIPIPDNPGDKTSSISFGVLIGTQSLGDRQALLNAGRKVVRFDVSGDVPDSIKALAEAL